MNLKTNERTAGFLIRYEETQVLQFVTGSTVYHLYGSDMKNFTFSVPPHHKQTTIAAVLSDMDAELAALEARRDKTSALKQAMRCKNSSPEGQGWYEQLSTAF